MKRLTEREYQAIKKGLKLGNNRQEVAKNVNRSVWTVHTVAQSSSYLDYCLIISKRYERRFKKQHAAKQGFITSLINFIKRK